MINVYSVLVRAANNKKALYPLLLQNQMWGPKPLCIRWIRHLDTFFGGSIFPESGPINLGNFQSY